MFDSSNPISTLSFLKASHISRDANGFHEGTVTCLSNFLLRKPAGAAVNEVICLSSSGYLPSEGKLTSYCEVVKYVQPMYATNDTIADAHMDIVNCKQPTGQSAVEYGQAFWKNVFCYGPVYENSISVN